MTVSMTVMDNKSLKFSKTITYTGKLLKCLSVCVLLLMLPTCKNTKSDDNIISTNVNKNSMIDSLTVSMPLPESHGITLMVSNNLWLEKNFIDFINISIRDTIISKKINHNDNIVEISYVILVFRNDETKEYRRHYLIYPDAKIINFKHDGLDYYLEESKHIKETTTIYNSFQELLNQKHHNKDILKYKLDSLYNHFRQEYNKPKDSLKSLLNEAYFIYTLNEIDKNDMRIEKYLKTLKYPVVSEPLKGFLYTYIEDRVDTIPFKRLDKQNYNAEYLRFIAIGVYRYLKADNHITDIKLRPALDWLKTTDFYSENKDHIEKELSTIDNKDFKKLLKELSLIDIHNNKIDFEHLTRLNTSSYYLIDFWATWCAPCIDGIKKMNEMKLPKNVSVISLSVDKIENFEKWATTTRELKQKVTFLMDEDNEHNKAFTKLIELKSIPRYVLIDSSLNLKEFAFLHPQGPGFLKKLKEKTGNR